METIYALLQTMRSLKSE